MRNSREPVLQSPPVGAPQPPPFSPLVLLTLLTVVVASSLTFWVLVRRSTSHRRWVAFSDWARETGFRFARRGAGEPPEPFTSIHNVRPVVRMQLARGPTTFVQLEAGELTSPGTGGVSPASRSPATWNLLVRKLDSA